MKLKYAQEMASVEKQPCPCTRQHVAMHTVAFRIFRRGEPDECFVIPALDGRCSDAPLSCNHFALSFYTSVEAAKRCISNNGRKYNFLKLVGDQIGEVEIFPADGLFSLHAPSSGHVRLFESENANFCGRIKRHSNGNFTNDFLAQVNP